jgi:drug/metabolite transporter (DMT)-like permease
MFKLSKRIQAEMSMLVVSFIWGATFVVVKNALADIGPFLFLGLRFTLAFLVLALLAFKDIRTIRYSTLFSGVLLGIFLFIGYANQTIGLKYTTSSNAGFIAGVSVVLVPIIYSVINKKVPSASTCLSVGVATVGLYLLSFQDNSFHLAYGDLLVLIGAIGFAFHIVFVDRYSHKHNPIAITGLQILLVGILSFILGGIYETWPAKITINVIGAVLITSVMATSLAFLTQNVMQKFSTPTRFAIVLTSEPVFAALTAYFAAGETFSSRSIAGAVLIILSMLISIITRREKNLVEANV